MKMGKFIVIEGLDGSGKATQAKLLYDNLVKRDKHVLKITFPDYSSPSSALVKMYLAGELGGLDSVNVYAASSFYAADRYASFVRSWKADYENGATIISDRYSTSNIVHQMPKLDETDWAGYISWLYDFEYSRMKLPKPDVVLYLDMAPETSKALIEKRYGGDEAKKDIHERDHNYLKACRRAALYAAKELGWHIIPCCDGKAPLPVETIQKKIFILSAD